LPQSGIRDDKKMPAKRHEWQHEWLALEAKSIEEKNGCVVRYVTNEMTAIRRDERRQP